MYSNLYTCPLNDSGQPFSTYIDHCEAFIKARRQDLHGSAHHVETIIDANCPYELYPTNPIFSGKRFKVGALLIHGLLDSPFSLRDIGTYLQAQGVYSRSLLLPGHGTNPSDLLHVVYQDWIQAVQLGIESLSQEVENIYLIGYSTGAALSIYHALQDDRIKGIVLLAPAIKIKTPVQALLKYRTLLHWVSKQKPWLYREKEIDYVKYLSVPINAVTQVAHLTSKLSQLIKKQTLTCPQFMSLSYEDETISSRSAIQFFSKTPHPDNQLLLYSATELPFKDPRIQIRPTQGYDTQILHFSHVSLPFSSNNPHYGKNGDYVNASNGNAENIIYGAYNRLEVDTYHFLHKIGAMKEKRRELTYNPDFDYLAERIARFITVKKLDPRLRGDDRPSRG